MKTAMFNRFIVGLPEQCVSDCSGPGSADDAVAHWSKKLNLDIPPNALRAELKEFGAWDAEQLSDHEANISRIIWIAAGNIAETDGKAHE